MAQADSPDTTTLPRVAFSSAGAVRSTVPGGIHRETILRQRHAAALPAVQIAHQALMAAIGAETPHAIIGYAADRFDVLERADHLKTVLTAVTTYAKAIVADTAHFAPTNILDGTGFLVDAASEVVGALNAACDRMLADQEIAAE
jgi:hypothetical protein